MSMKSKVVRKTRERSLNNRRQDAGSQPRLQNGEDKRKHFIARFRCQLYSKWIYESLVTLLPGTCLEKIGIFAFFHQLMTITSGLLK